jgi:hypothetical protein
MVIAEYGEIAVLFLSSSSSARLAVLLPGE